MNSISKPKMPGLYELLVISLGFGTVSLGHLGAAHMRIWAFLLGAILLGLPMAFLARNRSVIHGRMPFVLSALFFMSVMLSGLNAADLASWKKQSILLLAMLLLFEMVGQRCSVRQLLGNMRLVTYPGVLIAGWGIIEMVFFPSSLQLYYVGGLVVPRAHSFFAEANEFSQYLSLPFSFMLSALVFDKAIPKWERQFYYVGLVVVVMAQILTFSRGGILAFVTSLLILFFLLAASRGGTKKYVYKMLFWLLMIVLLLGVLYVTQPIIDALFHVLLERINSLFSGSDPTSNIRFDEIRMGLEAASQNTSTLIFGIGFGNLPTVLGEGVATTANLFVDVLSELGIFGLIAFCLIVFAVAILPIKTLRILTRSNDSKLLSVFFGAYLSYAGLIVGGLTYATHMLNFFWFIGGLLTAFVRYARKPEDRSAPVNATLDLHAPGLQIGRQE